MDKSKKGKYFLILIIIVAIFFFIKTHTLGEIWNGVVEFNLEISQKKVIWLFLIYWIEISIILIFWDALILDISINISYSVDKVAEAFLKKKRMRLSVLIIRLNYGIRKLMFFLRLGWVRYGFSNDDRIVWNSIRRRTIKDIILGIGFSLIKFPALISMLLTVISLKNFKLSDVSKILEYVSSFKVDFWEYAKLISPLITVVLIVFIGYFISFRGSIRRSIAQANRKKMEGIIQEQRDLVEAIGCSLYSIASNLQYVIKCQDLVADLWIHSKFPDYENENRRVWRELNVESYCFEDILELEIISQKFDELNSNGNWRAWRAFSSYKYEFLTVVATSNLLNLNRLNEIFFTKEGMKNILADTERPIIEYSKEEIQKMRENYLDGMPGRIVDSLELLYKLCRYYDEMNKLLNFKSDKVGRALRMVTGKE